MALEFYHHRLEIEDIRVEMADAVGEVVPAVKGYREGRVFHDLSFITTVDDDQDAEKRIKDIVDPMVGELVGNGVIGPARDIFDTDGLLEGQILRFVPGKVCLWVEAPHLAKYDIPKPFRLALGGTNV